MKKPKIMCCIELSHTPETARILEETGELTVDLSPREQAMERLVGVNALIPSLKYMVDAEFLDRAPDLELITTSSTGTDHIDIEGAKKRGITVLSLKDDYELLKSITSTAELAFALFLSLVRKIPAAFGSVKAGSWNSTVFRGREVGGMTFGILGYGRLGEIVARYANGFGMSVIATDPYKNIKDDFVKQVSFDKLLTEADVLSIHIHLDDSTRGLLGVREFKKMKRGIYIINTSRGAIIDEKALIDSLAAGFVAGAAVDVLTGELEGNVSENRLVKYAKEHNNLIITPHIGGVTYESEAKASKYTALKVKEYFSKIQH